MNRKRYNKWLIIGAIILIIILFAWLTFFEGGQGIEGALEVQDGL